MSEANSFSKRLQESMLNAGYKTRPVVLEREFNQRYWGNPISVQAVRRWLNGEAIPTQDRLQIIAEWLDVDPHWLRFGEKLSGSVRQQHKRWDIKMTPAERQSIEIFMSLPPEKRKMVGEIIAALAKP
ncbi:helix-turn-helix domain-containing protein [Marinomonas sp. M1K-6]|uniref:Helix-turn-helix domain-containing protein n=1 Tax=Marinomonas profundi TaxID=2726122 RepID=A0A847RF71_9GAMM|nr:transcriptional regulator [Marinomonas profundi]NLQ18910.1 helix-turn-helix domain-containing protein [Marinomonas profundi]UDV02845.1 helix-turn-helix domain-containing protein [Marinomonas profundi]